MKEFLCVCLVWVIACMVASARPHIGAFLAECDRISHEEYVRAANAETTDRAETPDRDR